jgi:hypothetical protein
MRSRLPTALVSLIALCLAVLVSPARAEFVVGPSINVARWFTWPRYDKAPATTIAGPPYNPTPKPPSAADLSALKHAGFETIRLPVDPAPFFVFEGQKREAVYKILFDAIHRIHGAGLKVIVDLHPNSRHPAWGQHAVIAGFDAPAFVAFNDAIGEMARRLAALDQNRVALELMNEPRLKCKGDQQAQWQQMLGRMIATARKSAPRLTLVVTGACVSSIEGLLALDPAVLHDRNLIYTFHFYEPFSFTHQGASFIPWPDKYLDEVPWPASKRPMEQVAARVDRNVERANLDLLAREKARIGARANLAKYYASHAGRGFIDKRFDQVADWARQHGVAPNRILIGEIGVLRKAGDRPGALCADRMRWLADVRGSAAKHGFAWSYFSYDGPFAIVATDQDHTLDADVLSALGLRSEPAACAGTGTH